MMKKLNYAVAVATLLGFAGFSGSVIAEDAAKKAQQAEQTKPDEKAQQAEQAKPDDKAQAGAVKLQDYSKAGAYTDGKQVAGSTGQTAGDMAGGEKGAAGPAAPAGDASTEKKPEAEKKQ